MNFCQAFSLIVLMPIFSWWLEIHDAFLGFAVIAIEAVSFLTTPLALNWTAFYLAQGIGMVGLCKYALLRSLLSKVHHFIKICDVISRSAQLNYKYRRCRRCHNTYIVVPGGIEPTTFALLARRSNQLSYGTQLTFSV